MADISSVAGHNGLGGLAVGLIDVIDSARMDMFDRVLGDPVFIILRELPHFNSRMQPSAAFIHGE
jgi:hypothetical protein